MKIFKALIFIIINYSHIIFASQVLGAQKLITESATITLAAVLIDHSKAEPCAKCELIAVAKTATQDEVVAALAKKFNVPVKTINYPADHGHYDVTQIGMIFMNLRAPQE